MYWLIARTNVARPGEGSMTWRTDVRFATIHRGSRDARPDDEVPMHGDPVRDTRPVTERLTDAGLRAHQRAVPVDLPADRPGLARLGQLLLPGQAVADRADPGARADRPVPAAPRDQQAGPEYLGQPRADDPQAAQGTPAELPAGRHGDLPGAAPAA